MVRMSSAHDHGWSVVLFMLGNCVPLVCVLRAFAPCEQGGWGLGGNGWGGFSTGGAKPLKAARVYLLPHLRRTSGLSARVPGELRWVTRSAPPGWRGGGQSPHQRPVLLLLFRAGLAVGLGFGALAEVAKKSLRPEDPSGELGPGRGGPWAQPPCVPGVRASRGASCPAFHVNK